VLTGGIVTANDKTYVTAAVILLPTRLTRELPPALQSERQLRNAAFGSPRSARAAASEPPIWPDVNVSRQTIYAIESGTYVPNTEVALHLARELEVTVDELFSLRAVSAHSADSITADIPRNVTMIRTRDQVVSVTA
jgi:DNA-binding XRE family transcriptional regulator